VKRLLKSIYINISIMVAVYAVVWFFAPGSIHNDALEAWSFAATLAVLVALDYAVAWLDKILDKRGDA